MLGFFGVRDGLLDGLRAGEIHWRVSNSFTAAQRRDARLRRGPGRVVAIETGPIVIRGYPQPDFANPPLRRRLRGAFLQSTAPRTVANIPSGLGGSRGLPLALLDVGQLLYPIRLRTLVFRFAALRLGILDLGLGRRAGLLLCCPNPGLRPALGLFDRIHTLSGHFVGLLLGGCGA